MKIHKYLLMMVLLFIGLLKGYSSNIIFEGKVVNFEYNLNDTILSICNEPLGLSSQECVDLLLDSQGEFRHEFEVSRISELLICYSKNCITILVEPEDEIHIEIDAKEFLNPKRIPKTVNVIGGNSNTNELVIDYLANFKENFYYHICFENQTMMRELNYEKYYEYMTKHLERAQNFLIDYIENKKIKDDKFIEWATSELIYSYGHNLYQFHFYASNFLADPSPDWYLKKIEETVPLNKSGATTGNSYSDYLHMKKIIMSKQFEMSEKGMKMISEKKTVWNAKLEYTLDNTKGEGKDIILSKFISDFIEYGKCEGFEKYINKIEDESIRKSLRQLLKEKKDENPET